MIDPDKSFNDLPLLPPSFDSNTVSLLKKVNTANKAVSRLDGLIRSLKQPEIILGPLKVKEAVESSSIENINTTLAEALQAELFTDDKLTSEQKETKNYKEALLHGFEIIQKQSFLTTNDYVALQEKLGIQHKGIRNLPGTKIANSTTGQVYYTPPEGAERLREFLNNFEQYYNNGSNDPDYLVKMAILHYQFEAIHPFFDGNGRVGRMLMVLYLVLHNLLISPTLFLSQYINAHRNHYYRLLREVTYENNWHEWIMFILEAVESQANATNTTILQILELEEQFRSEVLSTVSFTYSQEFLTYIFSNPFYTQGKLISSTPIKSNKTAGEYLNILEEKGVLKILNTKSKEKIYYYEDLLRLLG